MTDETQVTATPTKAATLTAEQIFARGRLRRVKEVPYLGGTVWAHGFSRMDAQRWREECVKAAGSVEKDGYSDERFVQKMIKDGPGPDAKCIFKPDDVLRLKDLNEAEWVPLYMACVTLNGWGHDSAEDIRKNSETTRSGDSGSGSQPGIESPTSST